MKQFIPYNVLLDPEGKIIAESLRGSALEEKVSGIIEIKIIQVNERRLSKVKKSRKEQYKGISKNYYFFMTSPLIPLL